MRRPEFWTIVLSLGLVAAPVSAAQDQRDMSNDCFDVAAPMAEATPCYEPRHHDHPHHRHHDRNTTASVARTIDAAGGGEPRIRGK